MSDQETNRLVILHELKGFRVRKGEPDIRGWDVVTSDRKKIGEVHELIVDRLDLKVRYLDVDVDSKVLETKKNSHVLIPIAGAQLDDDDNRVYLDEISLQELLALPPYDHRAITRDYETNIASWFQKASKRDTVSTTPVATASDLDPASPRRDPVAMPPDANDEFYKQDHFSEGRFWGKRRAGRENDAYIDRDGDGVPETSDRETLPDETEPRTR